MRPAVLAMLLLPAAASAQNQIVPPPRIIVLGMGNVSTPPDTAAIGFTVRGEGATADEAVTALNAKRKAIEEGLAALGKSGFEISAGQFAVAEVRGRECDGIAYQPRLSTGACAIMGYAATLPVNLRTHDIANTGTAVGLIGRLGGSNVHVEGFSLADAKEARRRAMATALDDARIQAEALAAGTKVKLGQILSIQDTAAQSPVPREEIVVSARTAVPPPPPAPPPPIRVDLKPQPIETQARVTVVYAIGS